MSEGGLLISILAAAITAGTPILYAALGELLTERAGVLNLGVEGMMLMGAVCGFMGAIATGNSWIGLAAAMLAGGAMAFLHAFLSVSLRANQVVSGLALTMFGTGPERLSGKSLYRYAGCQSVYGGTNGAVGFYSGYWSDFVPA